MKFFVLLLSLISLSAHAQFLKEICQSSPFIIRYQQSLIADHKTVWNAEGKELHSDEEGVMGFAQNGENLWVLKQDVIREFSPEGEVISEITLPELSVMGWGKNLFLAGEEFYIVRGNGLSRFNPKNKNFDWSVKLSDTGSTPITGATDGTHLYILQATTMEGGFIGISILNMQGEEVNRLPLNRSRSGVFAVNAIAHWYKDRLLVNNGGWMISFNQKQLNGKKALVSKLIPTFIQRPEGRKQLTMRGDFILTENGYSGCGSYSHLVDGQGKIHHDFFEIYL